MRRHPPLTRLAATLAAGAMLSPMPALASSTPAHGATSAAHGGARASWAPRPPTYPQTVVQQDLAIPMSDGTVLRGDLELPANADGQAVDKRFPVIVTITAYNKATGGFGGLAGGDGSYLVQRGYAQLTVDARGTGSSEGEWAAFSRREDQDAGEVVEWAHSRQRPWSNGRVGMSGPSYLGISQIFAAGERPAGLKAIFPQVPAADVYRDVVASGGAIDVGFIPLWLGLVTGTSVIPPQVAATDPQSGLGALFSHLTAAATFTAPLMLRALLGDEPAYDGPFYDDRSPGRVIDRVTVPTFLVGGEFDIFQRGTPLLFENLRKRGVPTKMIIGPWDHIQGSSGAEIGTAGYGSLSELQLRWFDRYVRGVPDPTLDRDIPPLTYYEQGSGRWTTGRQWMGRQRAASFRLSGPATAGGGHGVLTAGRAADGTAYVPPVPVSGLCTRSTNQWTAGLPRTALADLPCWSDNAANDRTGIVYETAPLTKALRLRGPINARLYTSSPTGDGMLSVAVSDVAPDGTVTRLTGGWQVLSHRALDTSRTRYLDGQVIQPFHPFTKAAQKPLASGEVAPVDVEVFPTAASIAPGHRLRIAVQAFDVPHLLPTAPSLPGMLTGLTIHSSAAYPSVLTVPRL
ncbi:CocE/NonD family hydrolase [Nocardioides sp. MAH-18]|uniref:CocE/NonD family hydrolase n=1 Tax=Nocardioides agri TaxID=2682843 RepID=A0A6L6XSJ2_9ACTN|nr:CocE/NonD family hydrolase [Nocardioides sp. CGMCC 1.13656]MBA2955329.1 CocE/NonD family hydrolase [Nocardioides sp. CGMCC 1.13656]MVQ50180.1 CocE/NonD family hydrolase [Nocardioides sp. MAH-18]